MDHRVPRAGVWSSLLLVARGGGHVRLPQQPLRGAGRPDQGDRRPDPAHARRSPTPSGCRPSSPCSSRASRSAASTGSRWDAGAQAGDGHASRSTTTSSCTRTRSCGSASAACSATRSSTWSPAARSRLPTLGDGDEVANTRPSVNFDEALDFLDEDGRADVRSVLARSPAGCPTPRHDERLNGTVGGLSRTIAEADAADRRAARPGGADRPAGHQRGGGARRARQPRGGGPRRSSARAARRSTRSPPTRARSSAGIAELPRLLAAGAALARGGPAARLRAARAGRATCARSPRTSRARWTRPAPYSLRGVATDLDATLDGAAARCGGRRADPRTRTSAR